MRSSSSLRRPLVLGAAVLATLVAFAAPAGAAVKAAVYYEPESTGNPTVAQLTSDLNYIFTRYASDPSYYKINGRPVIFAFADGADNCGMADRWKQANAGRFYVGLKVFNGYKLCASQPDAWHQYGPAAATDRQAGFSFSVSPGFWRADEATPRLARDPARFRTNLQSAVASAEPWIHVTTLNEWGEGSSVEPAAEWQSASGNGTYLDILHAELAATTQITATYLYPWYPETTVGGRMSHWTPSLGNPYDSGSPAIIARQRDLLNYGNFDVALTSWWGQGTPTDSRFPAILSGFAGTATTTDTTPPSQPGNFHNAGNVADPLTQIRVAWNASTDNVGVTGYDVTRNGALVDSRPATGLDHVSSGLTCGTSYTFTVKAKDAAGNRSTAASLTTSTAACSQPPPTTTGACGGATGTPAVTKVVWIWFENHGFGTITPTAAPYFNQIKAQCGYASNYRSVTACNSNPEYIAAASGSPQGICSNTTPAAHPVNANNIFRQADLAGRTWKSYQESMVGNCRKTDNSGYAVRHNAAPYFVAPNGANSCTTNDVPLPASPSFASDLTIVEPNLCNSMHDCSVTTGDNWLKGFLPKVIASPDYQAGRTMVVVTFDEGSGGSEVLFTLVMSKFVKPGTVSPQAFNHYSLLRTTQNVLGVGCLLSSCSAPDMRPAFGLQ